MNKSITSTANIISVLFHPLLITSIACIIIFNSGHYISLLDSQLKMSVYYIFIIMTFIIPALLIPALYYLNFIKSLALDEKNDRIAVLLVVGIIYAVSLFFMYKVNFPDILLNIMLSATASLFTCLIISSFYKISLHACGIGGLTALPFFLFLEYGIEIRHFLFLSFIVSGLVTTSRLITKQHTPSQVYLGWLCGFIIAFLILNFI